MESDQTVNSFHLHSPRIDIDLRRGGRAEGVAPWNICNSVSASYTISRRRCLVHYSMYCRETRMEDSKVQPPLPNRKNSSISLDVETS